jgi:hypothetical protein
MIEPFPSWPDVNSPAPRSVVAAGVELKAGDRVRLKPRRGADVFDLVLQGKLATIASIEQDFEGQVHLAVTVDDDPGRDLGQQLQSGHRFFFKLDEIEPIDEPARRRP